MLKQPSQQEKEANLSISTPSRPSKLPPVELTENAHSVFIRRYARRDMTGQPIETVEDTFWRVAYHIAQSEEVWGETTPPPPRSFTAC